MSYAPVETVREGIPSILEQRFKALPRILRILALEQPLNAGVLSAPYVYRFMQRWRVTGLFILPRTGNPADFATLEVFIEDQFGDALITDGRNRQSVPGLALSGKGIGWFGLDKLVEGRQMWTFQLLNTATVGSINPLVLLGVEEVTDNADA